jgi:hypothetical protein
VAKIRRRIFVSKNQVTIAGGLYALKLWPDGLIRGKDLAIEIEIDLFSPRGRNK